MTTINTSSSGHTGNVGQLNLTDPLTPKDKAGGPKELTVPLPTEGDKEDNFAPNRPLLESPKPTPANALNDWAAIPSPGMFILALLIKFGGEQRQQNTDTMIKQTELSYKTAMQEAQDMKNVAFKQLVMGIVSAGISMAGSVCQVLVLGLKGDKGFGLEKMKNLEPLTSAIGGIFSSASKSVDAGTQSIAAGAQAEAKELQAKQEKNRSEYDLLKDHNAALKDLVSKALSSSGEIQSGQNDMWKKLLA